MDESLYDEFGNYIGPDLEDEDEDLELEQQEEEEDMHAFETASPVAQEEPTEPVSETALMQVDGNYPTFPLEPSIVLVYSRLRI